VDRLVAVYKAERHDDEALAAFMRRADLARLKAALSDLEPITEDTADSSDFIDLAEDKAFAPEILEGECSA
jgi:hypothetical protein